MGGGSTFCLQASNPFFLLNWGQGDRWGGRESASQATIIKNKNKGGVAQWMAQPADGSKGLAV